MTPTPPLPRGLLLSDDLIFVSRITATARAVGLTVTSARNTATLIESARTVSPTAVILDLQNPGLELPALLASLRELSPTMPRVTAYGSHVDTETLKAARKAGCDRVMPRSQFVKELETGIAEWLEPKPDSQ